jgi:hypothetical protein
MFQLLEHRNSLSKSLLTYRSLVTIRLVLHVVQMFSAPRVVHGEPYAHWISIPIDVSYSNRCVRWPFKLMWPTPMAR